MRCKNSIRDIGKGRGNQEGRDGEAFFLSPVGGSESFCFSVLGGGGSAEGSRKVRNLGEVGLAWLHLPDPPATNASGIMKQ